MLIKRVTSSGANDLNTVYRPCTVDEVIGHDINKRVLRKSLEEGTLSHTMLFTGPAGCGKTTMARILSFGLNCESVDNSTATPCLKCTSCQTILDQRNLDVVEVNVGKDGGKAAVNELVKNLGYAPMHCRYKVLIFDEAHELSKSAQNLLLKVIEDGFTHVYFIFCTNKPEKLEQAFLSRNKIMDFGRMPEVQMQEMLMNICDFEGATYSEEGIKLITDASKGVPRDAIIFLKDVLDEGSWEPDSIKYVVSNHLIDEENPNIMEIGKALQAGSFKNALEILKKVKNLPEESLRVALAGFFTNRLKWCKTIPAADKCSMALEILTVPIYLSGKGAHHVLVNYLYKVSRIFNN